MCHNDDDISLFVASFDVPMSLGDLLQRITSIDDRLQLSRFYEVFEEDEIFRLRLRYPADYSFASAYEGPRHSEDCS